MENNRPLYRSERDSFSRDVYLPVCGAVCAPVVTKEIKHHADLSCLASERPPQIAIFHINERLQVTDEEKHEMSSLEHALRLCARSVPALYIDSENTIAPLAAFTDYHHLADAFLVSSYENREILKCAYEAMPLLRGMLDLRKSDASLNALASSAVSHHATSVILPGRRLTREAVNALQRRFIHVISSDESGFDVAALTGANGVITEKTDAAYEFLSRFPEGSFLRTHKLFAHKGFSDGGKYSENTITSVKAAGDNHFDGAEIDIKLTRDDVPIVMHNLNTRGLFDCDIMITEESDYAALAALRRIGFPDESVDTFEDLMRAMKSYEETPVLIELKPSAKYYNVEEMLRRIDPILKSPDTQKNCIAIMGSLAPGHEYVHQHLNYVPLGYCEGGSRMPDAPETRAQAEDALYRIFRLIRGCAAAYNGEDVKMNRLLNEYAKFRMLTVFPWSRSWTLEPSTWEEHGEDNVKTFLAGYDAWTTDHGEKFIDKPVKIEPVGNASSPMRPKCRAIFRDGHEEIMDCSLLPLSGNIHETVDGAYEWTGPARVLYALKIDLYFSESYIIYSAPVDLA